MFPLTFSHGIVIDTLYAKGRAFIFRLVSVRHSAFASFTNTFRYSYCKYRSAHGDGTKWLALNLQP